MKTTAAVVAILFASSVSSGVHAQNLFGDGGLMTDAESACLQNWEYKAGTGGAVTAVTGCISISEFPPFPFSSGGDTSILSDPTDIRTDTDSWCLTTAATDPRYNPANSAKNINWGYCLDKSLPITTPGQYADGGFQTGPTKCLDNWQFKVKFDNGTNALFDRSGCISRSDFEPYPFYTNEQDSVTLLPPSDARTDQTKWCPVSRDIYNPVASETPENRENWGFCLTVTDSEATDSPTLTPKTNSPTVFPTKPKTSSPTVAKTSSPTPNGQTPSPTAVGANPTDSPTALGATDSPTPGGTHSPTQLDESKPDPQKSSNDPDGGQIAGIVIGVALVAVAAVLAVLFMQQRYKNKKEQANSAGNDEENPDGDKKGADVEKQKGLNYF